MKQQILTSALLVLLAAPNAFGTTNYVVLGDDFQTKIDASAPGDTLVVQVGVYPGNLVFSKPVTVLDSGTNQIQLQGTVQVQGTGTSSFSQCEFLGQVQIQCTGTVSFAQCQFDQGASSQGANVLLSQDSCGTFSANLSFGSGTNLQAYDCSFYTLVVTGGKTLLKRSTITGSGGYGAGLYLSSNAALEALRLTNSGLTTATASPGAGIPFVAAQSQFQWLVSLTGYKVSLGYTSLRYASGSYGNPPQLQLTNCDGILVGNTIGSIGFFGPGTPFFENTTQATVYCEGGTLKAYHNVIGGACESAGSPTTIYGIWLKSTAAELVNNTIAITAGGGCEARDLYFSGGASAATVRGCVLWISGSGINWANIESAGPSAIVTYCDLYSVAYNTGSVIGLTTPVANCLFVNPSLDTSTGFLQGGSPCINNGPPDAIYNDRDGSRNDMGYAGGPLYNPANYTNNYPMLFFLAGSPQTVFKGAQTNIQVNVAASAGH